METTQIKSDSSIEEPNNRKDWPAESPVGTSQWSRIKTKYGLSRREIDVCKEICCGCSDKQVADMLGIAKGTIDGHVHNIYLKVGVHTRIRLLLRFLEV